MTKENAEMLIVGLLLIFLMIGLSGGMALFFHFKVHIPVRLWLAYGMMGSGGFFGGLCTGLWIGRYGRR